MENFIEVPNLPNNGVSLAVVDGRINLDIEKELAKLNIKLIKTRKIQGVYESIAFHPDIMLHHLNLNKIIVAPNISEAVVYELEANGFDIIVGKKEIGEKYPADISYNAARVGEYLICNIKYTDERLLENAMDMGLKLINTKQGYAKCSVCVTDNRSIITSDWGINKVLEKTEIDCCLIGSNGIELQNMSCGFIGGASGYVSTNQLSFYGDLTKHPDYQKINAFMIKKGKKPLNLGEKIINDFGTLIPLKEYSILTK